MGDFVRIKPLGASGRGRAYSPTSSPNAPGIFQIILKVYPHGMMSNYLNILAIGDSVDVCGPNPVPWIGKYRDDQKHGKYVAIIALGSIGITEVQQVIKSEILDIQREKIILLWSNTCAENLIGLEELNTLARASDGRLEVVVTLTRETTTTSSPPSCPPPQSPSSPSLSLADTDMSPAALFAPHSSDNDHDHNNFLRGRINADMLTTVFHSFTAPETVMLCVGTKQMERDICTTCCDQ